MTMSLLLLGIRIDEVVTETGPKKGGSRFRVKMWCSCRRPKHALDDWAGDSAVQPLLSALVETVGTLLQEYEESVECSPQHNEEYVVQVLHYLL